MDGRSDGTDVTWWEAPSHHVFRGLDPQTGRTICLDIEKLRCVHGPAAFRRLLGVSRAGMVAMLSGFGVTPLRSTITHWESRENRRCLNRRSRMGADSTRAYKRLIAHVCEAATDGEWTAIVHGRVYWRVELREVRR